MRDDSTIRVPDPVRVCRGANKKIRNQRCSGGYQLNQKMKEIRSALAEGDYMAEKSRRINLYSVSLRSDVDHHIKGNQENDIVNGEMIDLPSVPKGVLEQDHNDDYHKLTYVTDDFMKAICPVVTKVRKEKVWLRICVRQICFLTGTWGMA